MDDIHGEMGRMMGPMMGRVTFASEAVSSEEGVTAGAGVTPCGGTLQVSSRMRTPKIAGAGPAVGSHGVCGQRASARMPLARVREANAIARSRAWRHVGVREWQ